MNKPVDEWLHACLVPKMADGSDALVIKTIRHMEDGTTKPHLVIVDKPKRSFYVTKPDRRHNALKREWEHVVNLDRYEVHNHRLTDAVSNALSDGRYTGKGGGYQSLRKLCDSPWIYGADISIEVLVKHKFMQAFEASKKTPTQLTTGFFDIETDVVHGDGSSPNIITVTHENKVYTAILESFFVVKQLDGSFLRGNLESFKAFSKQTLDVYIGELLDDHVKKNPKSLLKKIVASKPFEYFYHVGKTAIDLVKWIFSEIHKNRTDFLGIWNIDFDIPKILAVIKAAGVKYEDVFCPPELNAKYRYVRYERDESDVPNIFKKWHWLHATSYSQFVDSQNLYSILRTVKGQEISMKLNDVLKVNDLKGKLTFKDDDPNTEDMSEMDWHRYMQKNEAYKYIIYNQFDCLSLQLQEWKNNDISSMVVLGGVSRLCGWTRQTRKIADSFYFYGLADGKIMASPGQTMEDQFDGLIDKVGGAVLRPERTTGIGIRVFSDRPDIVTMLHDHVNDVDFTGQYPTSTVVANISKETKISCGVEILGMPRNAVGNYYSMCIGLRENATLIAEKYFNLPNYSELDDRFVAYLQTTPT
jgi:hypothetical protein